MSTLVGVGANKNTNKKEIEKLENQVKELTEKKDKKSKEKE